MQQSVLIDCLKIKDPYTGLGQYCKALMQSLSAVPNNELALEFMLPKGFTSPDNASQTKSKWIERYIPSKRKYDIWHSTHQDSAFVPAEGNGIFILSIHDLNFLKEKSASKAAKRLSRLQQKVRRADHIITISNFTKSSLEKEFGIDPVKISVIYNGIEVGEPTTAQSNNPALVYLGLVHPKKNIESILRMMVHLGKDKLLLAGQGKLAYVEELKALCKKLKISDRVEFLGGIEEAEKANLLQSAKAFLFPSCTEGFGMPPLEAMRFGTPVFCFDCPPMPEISGGFSYIWKSEDANEMATQLINDLRSDKIGSAQRMKWSNKFSWEENAKAHLELYRQLLNR